MRILIRTSKWAIWARRFGSFALPLLVIPVWMHRTGILASDTFQIILALAMVFALLAVLLGLGAYIRLWRTGDRGWGRASTGIVLGLICLAPFAYGVTLAMRYPITADVSTDAARPPELFVKSPTVSPVPPPTREELLAAFPNVLNRTYQMEAGKLFELVQLLVEERGWEIRVRRAPTDQGGEGQVNAMAMTFFGWRDEIALRVSPLDGRAQIAMRSASLSAVHDLGRNGTRIEAFLLDLDNLVSKANREVNIPVEEHPEANAN